MPAISDNADFRLSVRIADGGAGTAAPKAPAAVDREDGVVIAVGFVMRQVSRDNPNKGFPATSSNMRICLSQ